MNRSVRGSFYGCERLAWHRAADISDTYPSLSQDNAGFRTVLDPRREIVKKEVER